MSLHSKSNSVWSRLIHASSIYSIFLQFWDTCCSLFAFKSHKVVPTKTLEKWQKGTTFPSFSIDGLQKMCYNYYELLYPNMRCYYGKRKTLH